MSFYETRLRALIIYSLRAGWLRDTQWIAREVAKCMYPEIEDLDHFSLVPIPIPDIDKALEELRLLGDVCNNVRMWGIPTKRMHLGVPQC